MKFFVYVHLTADTLVPFYIGKGMKQRYASRHNRNKFWKNIVGKHGFFAIKLIENLEEDEALYWEKFYIKLIGTRELMTGTLVNFTDGGKGVSGYKFSEESLQRKEEGRKKWLQTLSISEREAINLKISTALRGKIKSSKHCHNLSIAKLGKSTVGSVKGHIVTEMTKEKLRHYFRNSPQKYSKPIEAKHRETGETFKFISVSQACRELGVTAYECQWNSNKIYELTKL